MCAIAVQGPFHSARVYLHKRPQEGNVTGRTRRAFKPGRKARRKRAREIERERERKKSAITFARVRLILICILIAVAVIGGYWFRVCPAICGEKGVIRMSRDELFARFDSRARFSAVRAARGDEGCGRRGFESTRKRANRKGSLPEPGHGFMRSEFTE